ncbi:MAG: CDP-alcohol phosphatidyltransferase family protein [Candidatus Nitrohelix vancouverensis]|uniref:CDP-alcohol phosphatidyltransferase family protein n=1 Tax=Candidatus Nitrohelix vancouverensis TaxID=2705534 RepID=A0A7T0G297_9BACT|nr:MAG: CDP-alcohol phosphatidyltransferase family protein [Candidatus Nitrohelix vancouverensis]
MQIVDPPGKSLALGALNAVILFPQSTSRLVAFEKDVAGLTLFKRMAIALSRAGVVNIQVVDHDLAETERKELVRELQSDSRFEGHVSWAKDPLGDWTERWSRSPCLLVRGPSIIFPDTLKAFIRSEDTQEALEKDQAAQLRLTGSGLAPLWIAPRGRADLLRQWLKGENLNPAVSSLPGDRHYFSLVQTISQLRVAEKKYISLHRHHYHQAMDIWFNSIFSLRLSALFVKTRVTPNQLTLFGLVIGIVAGYCFSRGDYAGGLVGGILLALTAIWDCCDGDVARLKFMQSDFGERLDTACDNLINVFIFTGMMLGVARVEGLQSALIPFSMLAVGGFAIFCLIYFPGGGKGAGFKDSPMHDVVMVLASRNFIYVILLFAVFGKIEAFLWLAGWGSLAFALILFIAWRNTKAPVRS